MTEIKTDNTVIVAGKDANIRVDAAPEAPAAATALPHEMSKGEKWYNWTVYSGINYWVNLVGSVILADELISGRLKKPFQYTVGKIAQVVEKVGKVPLQKGYYNTKVVMETLALTGGGWLLLVPMKFMEDRKRPIVHWLNEKFGVDQTAPDGHQLTADEIYIEKEQPKQSWLRVIGRRVLASVLVIGTGSALDKLAADKNSPTRHTKYPLNPYAKEIEYIPHDGKIGGKERTTDWIVHDVLGKGVSMFPKGDKVAAKLKGDGAIARYVGLGALDTFFTKITAMTLYMTNGAKKEKQSAPNLIEDTPSLPLDEEPNATPPKRFSEQVKPRQTNILISKQRAAGDRFVDRVSPDNSSSLQPGMS